MKAALYLGVRSSFPVMMMEGRSLFKSPGGGDHVEQRSPYALKKRTEQLPQLALCSPSGARRRSGSARFLL